jgi:CheY-like chemotaxis protein
MKQRDPLERAPAREEREPDAGSPLILLGDDSELALEVLGDFLESRNYRIIKARNSAEVLTSLMEYHPDVLLLDVQMPGVDGLETLRILRSHPESHLAQTPVIMVTAMAISGDRERCLAAGANEYVSKPVYLTQLSKLIQKYTGGKHTIQPTGEIRND